MRRGAVTKSESKPLVLWVPESLMPLLDQGVKLTDSDRSKFIRNAVREKLRRMGIDVPPPVAS